MMVSKRTAAFLLILDVFVIIGFFLGGLVGSQLGKKEDYPIIEPQEEGGAPFLHYLPLLMFMILGLPSLSAIAIGKLTHRFIGLVSHPFLFIFHGIITFFSLWIWEDFTGIIIFADPEAGTITYFPPELLFFTVLGILSGVLLTLFISIITKPDINPS